MRPMRVFRAESSRGIGQRSSLTASGRTRTGERAIILGMAMRITYPGQTGREADASISSMTLRGLQYRLRGCSSMATKCCAKRRLEGPNRFTGKHHARAGCQQRRAERDDVFNGGMMGGMMMRDRGMEDGHDGDDAERENLVHQRPGARRSCARAYATLKRGRSYVLAMNNETTWWHPMHLHGHAFRVISRNGRPDAVPRMARHCA